MRSSGSSTLAEAAPARRVKFLDFPAQFAEERDALIPLIVDVFARGNFIGGDEIERLEDELAHYLGVRHVVALSSGTDALIFALRALGIGPGDEVITPSNSFVASTAAIVHAGARPVFADVTGDQTLDPQAVAAAITPRTRAIMPVHLTGRVANMSELGALAERHSLALVEDAAQAFGSKEGERYAGTFGVGCFSAHPLKNLGAAGDAGFLVTNDAALSGRVRLLRNHGLSDRDTALSFGYVSRLDTLQAAVLRHRLTRVDDVIARRRVNAGIYDALLERRAVFVPETPLDTFHTYHLYVVQAERRDTLRTWLERRGIATKIHYPVPIHLQPAGERLGFPRGSLPQTERQAERILSIPIHQFLTPDDVAYVADAINEFYR
ncbi:MAG: DegT/DnrJ/EryC1/StrS family aminotransferase [Candidatus Eremiobacteraeota bacterium]|nr:DegT/DnrJ/EryC1/StrS family aminotransferase [Candidatus Eremiobacteraeota bacterium]